LSGYGDTFPYINTAAAFVN